MKGTRKTIPGLSVTTRSPERRAIRCTTRSEYTSSSFVPNSTDRTTPTAAAARATPSADQKESIERPELIRPARSSIPASTNSTPKKPTKAVNGSLRAATSGGSTALSRAMTAAATRAERKVESDAPGTSSVAGKRRASGPPARRVVRSTRHASNGLFRKTLQAAPWSGMSSVTAPTARCGLRLR